MSDRVEWRLRRVADDSVEDALFDVEVVDAVNRFGRHAIVWIDDEGGEKWTQYPRGSAHELEVSDDGGETFTRRFAGYVVERREADNQGADELEVELYSFDHFLRRNRFSRDLTGDSIATALEGIIDDFTPVKWEPGNVTVGEETTLNREFEGEIVEAAISELATKSQNEEFGVNDDLEFFFRPRETDTAPRDIEDDQWLDYDIPELGKEALNEFELFYGDGDDEASIVVDDGGDKFSLQDSIGANSPVVLYDFAVREDIDNESDARDKAEELLEQRESTLTGEVTTFGLFDARPGDLINVTINSRDLDGEFRIAELRYNWGRDETTVTIVERRGDQDETLIRITDTLKRVEGRDANRDAPTTILKELGVDLEWTVALRVSQNSYADDAFRFGDFGDGVGAEGVGGTLGDQLVERVEVISP